MESDAGDLCSRPAGHDGPHAACTPAQHPKTTWPASDDDLDPKTLRAVDDLGPTRAERLAAEFDSLDELLSVVSPHAKGLGAPARLLRLDGFGPRIASRTCTRLTRHFADRIDGVDADDLAPDGSGRVTDPDPDVPPSGVEWNAPANGDDPMPDGGVRVAPSGTATVDAGPPTYDLDDLSVGESVQLRYRGAVAVHGSPDWRSTTGTVTDATPFGPDAHADRRTVTVAREGQPSLRVTHGGGVYRLDSRQTVGSCAQFYPVDDAGATDDDADVPDDDADAPAPGDADS